MQTILITGASRGIGLELVKQYADDGWKIFACCRNPAKATVLKKLAASNQAISIHQLDVTKEKEIQNLARTLRGPIDILFNCAGIIGTDDTIADVNVDEWLTVFKTNTIGPFLMARAFIPQVLKSKLKIIANMSSIMGSIAFDNSGGDYIYKSSKAALNSVLKTLANELTAKGISIISLHPGWVKTDMGGPNAPISPEESVKGLRKVLSKVTLKNTGSFVSYEGKKLPW